MLSLQPISSAATLIHFLVNTYYAHLTSVLIVYETSNNFNNVLQQHYLDAVQNAFNNQSQHSNSIGLQWINVNYLNDTEEDFEEHMLKVVDIVSVEGFITILTNTSRFLHARYYATRYAKLRLKDKIYLFLCEETENPKEILSTEILQFYPHHLMVIPAATIHILSNKDHNQKKNIKVTKTTATPTPTSQITEKPNIKQKTSLAKRTTRATATKNLNITNVAMDIIGIVDVNTTTSSFTNFCTNDKNNKYRDINFELWTQQYVGAEGNLNAIHLDTYISSSGGESGGGGSGGGTFEKTTELYPNKLWNLQQRTMRIGSLTYVPYVKTYYVSPGEGDVDSFNSKGPNKTVSFMGVEAELIKTFCQIRNCHLRIKPYPADNWGIIYENGSADGMLGDLYYQHTEMAIGCIYNWYNDITETSQFIARSAVTILGPGPAQFSRWRINIMPFSLSLWIFLIFTLISCSLMFHFIQLTTFRYKQPNRAANSNKYERIKYYEKTLLDIFAIFIQQPSADTGLHRVATRIFLAFLLCATITLENTYSGQLKSLLTMPLFSEPVDTMHKWSLTNWKWGAPSIIWKQTVENSHLAMEQRLSNKFEVRDYGYLYNASFWDNYGLAVERIYSGSFSFGDYITAPALETKIVPKDDLYFDWTRAVAIRGWPLMPLLDRHILYCLETGIYIFWEKQNSYKYLDHQVQDILATLANGYRPKSPPQILSIEHISGPLFILLFGNLMAFVVLLVELSFGYRLKKSFQQIKTIENSE